MVQIETNRLIIREFDMSDLDAYHVMKSKPNLAYYAGIKPHPNKQTSKLRLQNSIFTRDYYALTLKDGTLIGDINFYKDPLRRATDAFQLGFMLDDTYHHKGYMQEALTAFIPYIFKRFNVDVLTCVSIISNVKAQRTIEALGFNYDGVIRHYKRLYNNDMVDCKIYTMTKQEYERNDKLWHMN